MNINENYAKLLKPYDEVLYYFSASEKDKILIIAPHPDDEILGCGGIIKKFLSSSIQVEILLLTDGSGEIHRKTLSQVRKNEFNSALFDMGNISNVCLEFPDGELDKYFKQLVDAMVEYFKKNQPRIIFVPYILDYNIDHRISNYALTEVFKKIKFINSYIAMYEIWTPIIYPNHYINITKEFGAKYTALKCYETQEKYYRILEKVELLNKLRAKLSMRTKVEYMECFKGFSVYDYIDIIEYCKSNIF